MPMEDRADLAISPALSAEAALRLIVVACCADFDAALLVLRTTDDPAGPHQARVALRRLRSALAAFAGIIDARVAARLLKKTKALFRLIGTLRDADVLLHEYSNPKTQSKQEAHAEKTRAKVRAALRSKGAHRHAALLVKLVAGKGWHRGGRKAKALRRAPVATIAAAALTKVWARCTSHGPDLAAMTVAQRHDLRKDLKTLRYQTEFFGPLWPGPAQQHFLDQMRDLQDALGTLNDISLAEAALERRETLAPSQSLRADLALTAAARMWQLLGTLPPWWATP